MKISLNSYLISASILFLIYGIYLLILKKYHPKQLKSRAILLFIIGLAETQFLPVMYEFAKNAFEYKNWAVLIFPIVMSIIFIWNFMTIVKRDFNITPSTMFQTTKGKKLLLYFIVILPFLVVALTVLINSNQPPLWLIITVLLMVVLILVLGYTAIFKEETIGKINRKRNDFDEESDSKNEAEENERK